MKRQRAFWAIWFTIVVAVIWWFAWIASGVTPPPLPGTKKASVKETAVQQGAGALALIKPAAVIIPPKPIYVRYYFAATAISNLLESDFSNEIIVTNDIRSGIETVTLAWDHASASNVTYLIYKGRTNGVYTISYPAGTNLTLAVPLAWPAKTNIEITVTCVNGGTNIAYATKLTGPWTFVGTNRWVDTNPPSPRYFRGIGSASNRVTISRRIY